jgi:hypothetical protein
MPSAIPASLKTLPWWKYGYVWLVIMGPVAVVLASLVTVWLTIHSPDPIVTPDYYRQGIEINKTLEQSDGSLTPAVQARNHAATPGAPKSP